MRWSWSDPQFAFSFRGPAVTDLNGDGVPDVVFGTSRGMLRALDGGNGSSILEMDLRAEYGDERFELDHAPLVSDFDGDGLLDIFIAGGYGVIPMDENFGRAYMITVGTDAGPEWRMFQRDILRRGNVCAEPVSAIGESPLPELEAYPNPTASDLWVPSLTAGTGYRVFHAAGGVAATGFVQEQGLVATAHLPAGAYFLVVVERTRSRTLRFVRI